VGPEAASSALASQLVQETSSPSRAASRAERKALVEAALEKMEPLDREILALRCFERLSGKDPLLGQLGKRRPLSSRMALAGLVEAGV
jgi:hypothetical protein